MADMSPAEFGAGLLAIAAEMKHAKKEALEHVGALVEKEARSYPGSYQPGWPALRPETIARKATGDSPLLETGKTRESFGHIVQTSRDQVIIGSDEDTALWHELGTVKMPPRPLFSQALMTKTPQILTYLHAQFLRMFTVRMN
jgi:hypothetical protein